MGITVQEALLLLLMLRNALQVSLATWMCTSSLFLVSQELSLSHQAKVNALHVKMGSTVLTKHPLPFNHQLDTMLMILT